MRCVGACVSLAQQKVFRCKRELLLSLSDAESVIWPGIIIPNFIPKIENLVFGKGPAFCGWVGIFLRGWREAQSLVGEFF